MNLDFLDVLSQRAQENVGTVRTERTGNIHASLSVPNPVLAVENYENQIPSDGGGSQWFPGGSQVELTRKTNLPADVPKVLKEKEQVCTEWVRFQVSSWLDARCTCSRRAWAAEKFLYSDYAAWCCQCHQPPIPRKLLCVVLNKLFDRDGDGWHGLCLAVDLMATKELGSQPMYPMAQATKRTQ
jgi:hypothetical protein